jgi:anti-sigma regulatory factor (Ser/Thr protein kinase)
VKRVLTIRTDLAELESVLAWIHALAEEEGLPDGLAGELFLMAEEILANTISHGCGDEAEHRIEIEAMREDDVVTLVFRDDARAFDPLVEAPSPDLESPIEDRPVGGLGIHLVKSLADRLRYAREGGMNVLTVEKTIPPNSIPPEENP